MSSSVLLHRCLLLHLLTGLHLSILQLLHVERLSLGQKLLPLELQSFLFTVHNGLQLFKVSEFELQLLHLSLH